MSRFLRYERLRYPTDRERSVRGAAAAIVVIGGACLLGSLIGNGDETEPSDRQVTPDTVTQTTHKAEYDVDGSSWPVECEGPADRFFEAAHGDTLLNLAAEHTIFVQPAAIDQPDVPLEVYVQAVADMNDIEDPNVIMAGQEYFMPMICQPQTIER